MAELSRGSFAGGCPTLKSLRFVKTVPFAKIFRVIRSANQPYVSPRPHPLRGTYRDRQGRWVWDGMDVLAQLTNAAKADGEGVWS